ncbi:hypothetical protein PAXINDRAFT_11376 [Paxillus involutus ATCC 200175]|uniref:Uncharacterized protein n=1 Tax=Paxillus involutus ATCC 200175 TaxID=664439 RepID=A0A0C9TZG1_PAXIN|nr:hypothetical protein PAXINDRAFT_11376 [Paxillus involutus ATCC 200175]
MAKIITYWVVVVILACLISRPSSGLPSILSKPVQANEPRTLLGKPYRRLWGLPSPEQVDAFPAIAAGVSTAYERKHSLPDFQITSTLLEEGKLADLTLADTQSSSLDENDFRFLELFDLNFVTDVTKFLAAFPLRTALKAFKIFAGVPEEHPVDKLLRFKDVNNLCGIRGDRFDLLALPGENATDLSLLVVVVPPWDIRFDDLKEFIREGMPTEGSLDLGASVPSPHTVLWALIWDICWEHNCRFFVLSNYDQWVFGNFSNNMRHAQVTTYMRAPVFPKEQNVRAEDRW